LFEIKETLSRISHIIVDYERGLRVSQGSEPADFEFERPETISRFEAIEKAVNEMKAPASFGDQLYVLRDHVRLVRERLLAMAQSMDKAREVEQPPVA